MWRELIANGIINLELEAQHIESAGDLAFGTGIAKATVHTAGGSLVIMAGRYAVAFRRQPDGAWRNVVDMYTIDSQQRLSD